MLMSLRLETTGDDFVHWAKLAVEGKEGDVVLRRERLLGMREGP